MRLSAAAAALLLLFTIFDIYFSGFRCAMRLLSFSFFDGFRVRYFAPCAYSLCYYDARHYAFFADAYL